jgi:hypothetical protein
MKRQQLLLLSAVTIVIIIAAALFNQSRAPQTTIEKETLFPELANRINDVTRIEIKSSEDPDVILQKMQGGQWALQSADNYPAQFDKVKDVVVSLSQLKILATKTDNPKLYPELGVEGPQGNNTSSLLLTLSDQSGTALASLIVGKPRKSSTGSNRPNLYVRKADAKNALLVEGYLQLKSNNNAWYERNVIHIPASRIQKVNIFKSTGDLLLIKKHSEGDTEFKVIEGNTASPSVLLNKLGTFFEDMHVEGVHAANNFEFPDDVTITTFTTFNGLVITVKNVLNDGKAYAHFSFKTSTISSSPLNTEGGDGTPESHSETISVEEESQLWNQFLSHWVYEIPEFKFETLDVNVAQSSE